MTVVDHYCVPVRPTGDGEVGVDVPAGQRSGRGRRAHLGGWVGDVAATQTPGTSVVPATPDATR